MLALFKSEVKTRQCILILFSICLSDFHSSLLSHLFPFFLLSFRPSIGGCTSAQLILQNLYKTSFSCSFPNCLLLSHIQILYLSTHIPTTDNILGFRYIKGKMFRSCFHCHKKLGPEIGLMGINCSYLGFV